MPQWTADFSPRASAAGLLALALFTLVYGSLYPWQFRIPSVRAWDYFWDQRHLQHEFILNIVLYVPVGFLLLGVTRSRWKSIAGGFLISASIEAIQPFFGRDARALDLTANTAGAIVGTALAYVANAAAGRIWLPAGSLLLVTLWVFHQLYPFIRTFYARWMLYTSFSRPSSTDVIEAGTDWTAAFCLTTAAVSRRRRLAVAAVAAALPLRPLVSGRPPTRAEWTGWMIAFVISVAAAPRLIAPRLCVGVALAVTTLMRELAPFRFAPVPSTFYWNPFQAVLSSDWFLAVITITQKTFVYGAIIWLLGTPGRIGRTTAAVAVALGVLEWIQRWLPGRTPDITDPILAVLAGLCLWLLPESRKPAAYTDS